MDADTFLTEDERAQVREAIEEAEQRTAAELVCAVATESDRYDRAESIAGLGFALLTLGAINAGHAYGATAPGSWGPTTGPGFAIQAVSIVGGFIIGSVIASFWHGLRRLLVRPSHLESAVHRAAWRVFGMRKIRRTSRDSGMLIYVSLFERQVAVLADERARAALGDEGIDELRDVAVEQLREGRGVETFVATIRRAADLLEDELPEDNEEVDELEDQVLRFDPRPD